MLHLFWKVRELGIRLSLVKPRVYPDSPKRMPGVSIREQMLAIRGRRVMAARKSRIRRVSLKRLLGA